VNKEQIDKLIDDYVNNRLSSKEKSLLDKLLLESPDLKQEIIMRKDISKGVEYYNNQELKALLNTIHNEEVENLKPKKTIWGRAILWIGILSLALLAYLLMQSIEGSSHEENSNLYAAYYVPYNPSIQNRGEEIPNDLSLFYDYYYKKDYQAAFNIISEKSDAYSNETILTTAICALEINQNEKAISLFDQIILTDDPYFSDHARWYKALLLLNISQKNEAKNLLKVLSSDPKTDHHQEAKELLEKL